MTGPEPPSRLHTEEDLERGRSNPLFTLGLDKPYDGMFRISFENGDLLALHVRGEDAARAAAREVTRLCLHGWALERYSPADGWTATGLHGRPPTTPATDPEDA